MKRRKIESSVKSVINLVGIESLALPGFKKLICSCCLDLNFDKRFQIVNKTCIKNVVLLCLNFMTFEEYVKSISRDIPKSNCVKFSFTLPKKKKKKKNQVQRGDDELRLFNERFFRIFSKCSGAEFPGHFRMRKLLQSAGGTEYHKGKGPKNLRIPTFQLAEFGFPVKKEEYDVKTVKSPVPGRKNKIYVLDCEMVKTMEGASSDSEGKDVELEVVRTTLLDFHSGATVYDEMNHPRNPIVDYNTKFSGITKESFSGVEKQLCDIQEDFVGIVSNTDYLIGHSLENDLTKLRVSHSNIIDTTHLYPHPSKYPYRLSLKHLAKKYLHREIQNNSAGEGHDSVEDCQACLDLVKLQCYFGGKKLKATKLRKKFLAELARFSSSSADGKRNSVCVVFDSNQRVSMVLLPPKKSNKNGQQGGGSGRMEVKPIQPKNDAEVLENTMKTLQKKWQGTSTSTSTISFTTFRALEQNVFAKAKAEIEEEKEEKEELKIMEVGGQKKADSEEIIGEMMKMVSKLYAVAAPNTLFISFSPHGLKSGQVVGGGLTSLAPGFIHVYTK